MIVQESDSFTIKVNKMELDILASVINASWSEDGAVNDAIQGMNDELCGYAEFTTADTVEVTVL